MKHAVLFFCVLLLYLVVAGPGAAVSDSASAEITAEPIIHGVTLDPSGEPAITSPVTRETTGEQTVVPTTGKTAEPIPSSTLPGPEVGWLSITSTPSAASVEIDGKLAGVTPVIGRELGAGTSHTVRISMDGFEPYATSVTVSAGEEAAVDGTLIQLPTPVPTTVPTVVPTHEPIGGGKGWISVSANVDGAVVAFDNNAPGCTIAAGSCDTEVTVTGTPYRTFIVRRAGFSTYTGDVTGWPQQGETVHLYATLNPVQTTGSVVVSSYPSGAVAYLDGQTWQYTPCTFSAVTAGSNHIVQISLAGYQPFSTTVYVPSGGSAPVSITLTEDPAASGSLSIVTTPAGADSYIDGQYRGPSPAIVANLAPGRHTVRLQKAGYDEYLSTVAVSAGQRTPVTVTFSRSPPGVGSIEVTSSPAGAALYLDGHYMGRTPTGDSFDLTSILPGLHTIQLQLDDYQTSTRTVRVTAGGITTVNALLTPVQPGPVKDSTGELVITSAPAGANIFLDNAFRGISPLTLSDVPEGQHVLLIREAGYADHSENVMVTAGIATPVEATLTAIVPAPTKSPLCGLVAILGIVFAGSALVLRRR